MSWTGPVFGGPWRTWVLTRLAALALGALAAATVHGNVFVDTSYYAQWAHGTLSGTRVPYRDFVWEYPPVALPVMLVPAVVGFLLRGGWQSAYGLQYSATWIGLVLAVDAALLGRLLRLTAPQRDHPAVTLWLWGIPLLGALSWSRYDLLPAAAAALAVLYAGAGGSRRSAMWASLGGALKLWPLLLAPVHRTRRAALQASAAGVVVIGAVAACTFALTGSTGFAQVLSYQSRRGLQCESLAALPFLWLRHLHVRGYHVRRAFGSWDVVGPHVGAAQAIGTALGAAGVLALGLAHWRLMKRDAGPGGVAVTAMALLLTVVATDKVFSPQYVLWLVSVLAAAVVLDPETWRAYVPWALLVAALTAIAFPWSYGDVLGTGWFGLLALTARDAIVVGMTVAVASAVLTRLTAPIISPP